VTNDREGEIRNRARELIAGGQVDLLVGYGRTYVGDGVRPVFVRSESDADRLVWNDRCVHNLATYLMREPCQEYLTKGRRIGIVAKGCDVRAILALVQEKQLARDSVHIIGVVCGGMRDPDSEGIDVKCAACEWQVPPAYDDLVGDRTEVKPVEGDPLEDVKAIERLPRAERWRFWTEAFSRCIKCYACRQACPLCYCKECITEKSQPQWIEKAPSLRGNLAYHFIRAMHLAGRCVSCGECSRACPMEIPVDRLTRQLSRTVEEAFGYRPGVDPEDEPFFVTFADSDPEDFIR
jgi:formate dehydrogenase subunit beta